MNPLIQIGLLVLQTLGSLYLLIVLLRFLLQVARADFYNPISQFVARATNPLLLPLRRVIPGLFGLDLAALVLALAVEFVTVLASSLLFGFFNPLTALAWSVVGIVSFVLHIYYVSMIAMIVLSWVAPYTRHPAAVLVFQLVQPLCLPFRRLLPAMGGIDLSPIFIFLALQAARILLNSAAASMGMGGAAQHLVPGMF